MFNPHASPEMNYEMSPCPTYAPQPDGSVACVTSAAVCRACGVEVARPGPPTDEHPDGVPRPARCPRTQSALAERKRLLDERTYTITDALGVQKVVL